MNVSLHFGVEIPGMNWRDELAIQNGVGKRLFTGYNVDTAPDLWSFDVTVPQRWQRPRAELERALPPKGFLKELIFPSFASREEVATVDWFLVRSFADDASRAEKTHHTDSFISCPACGNQYQDPDFDLKVSPAKFPVTPKLMTFYGSLKLFCRPKFINRYEQSGLTGMTFRDWGVKDRHGIPLSRIGVELHRWQDRAGVCDACEMKTNLTTDVGCFNTHEQFKYDIQYLRTPLGFSSDPTEIFVLSRRAVDFFVEVSSYMQTVMEEPTSVVPIMPGHLEDIVWPEPRLFAHGEKPTRMLRASWA